MQAGVVVVAAWLDEIDHGGIGRYEVRALLLHQLQRLVRQIRAMLDTAHTALHCGERAFLAVGMSHDRLALRCRLLDHRRDFPFRIQLLARIGVGRAGALG
jgi:hypothetical protein